MNEVSEFFQPPVTSGESLSGSLEKIYSSEQGFTEIYRGKQDGKFRAFKCLKPAFRGDPVPESILRKEYEIGYPLSHPNICEYYAYRWLDTLGNCIEMEWVDGATLDKIPYPDEERFLKIAREMCSALSYLHARQIIHRDIKPSNILVTYNGYNVKLIDFSLSDSDSYAILKLPAGTRKYAAPEVLEQTATDCRSDLYSLGVVLQGLTTGHKAVLRKCCRRNPDERYSSAEQFRTALLKPHKKIWPLMLAAVLLAGVVFLLHPWRQESGAETLPELPLPKEPVQDNAPVLLPPSDTDNAREPSKKKAGRPREKVDTADIGNIFRQATELFE